MLPHLCLYDACEPLTSAFLPLLLVVVVFLTFAYRRVW